MCLFSKSKVIHVKKDMIEQRVFINHIIVYLKILSIRQNKTCEMWSGPELNFRPFVVCRSSLRTKYLEDRKDLN